MPVSSLISVEELHSLIGENSLLVFDCRFSLKNPAEGVDRYRQGHIPGAIYANLDEDLSRLTTPHCGRHPLPPSDAFRHWLESQGVGDDSLLVCYDDVGGAIAARLWWMAGWIGVENVRLLDGGFDAWCAAGFGTDTREPEPVPATLSESRPRREICDIDEVSHIASGDSDCLLLDAREAARFEGRHEPLDPVAGHIPRSINAPFGANLDERKRFLAPDLLRARFESLLGAEIDPCGVVHMCGSGVTACHNLLAMEVAGLNGSRLFPGSWSQWVDDLERPVETGRDTMEDKE
ncbi:MAG: sulfurtransferase [Proteobacteria bacterium]|nr:MAG: sulfurtransferase [Pseudomonadota bacterium]